MVAGFEARDQRAFRPRLHPDAHFGKTYALLGPVEMDHEQMAAELTTALGYQVNFEDMPIESFREMLVKVGVTPFRVSHLVASM